MNEGAGVRLNEIGTKKYHSDNPVLDASRRLFPFLTRCFRFGPRLARDIPGTLVEYRFQQYITRVNLWCLCLSGFNKFIGYSKYYFEYKTVGSPTQLN